MPQKQTNSSTDIFDFLKNRFELTSIIDKDGNPTVIPDKMAMFTFNFVTKSGQELGTIVISLLDDNDSSNSLKIYYGKDVADANGDESKEFYDFLNDLRMFAMAHMLGFDVRDINRTKVTKQDIAPAISESAFGPIDGTVKTSIQPLENLRIIIKHSDRVDPKMKGARSRRIHRLYLANGQGERFLLPFRSLKAARAMARHVHNGGNPYDEIGERIASLVDEISSLTKFIRKTRGLTETDDQELQEVLSACQERQHTVKNLLGSMGSQGGYMRHKAAFESEGNEISEDCVLDEMLISRWKIDEQLSDTIPYVARAYNNRKSSRPPTEFNAFKNWINQPVDQSAVEESFGAAMGLGMGNTPEERNKNRKKALTVPCTQCNSKVGQACMRRNFKGGGYYSAPHAPHSERLKTAKEVTENTEARNRRFFVRPAGTDLYDVCDALDGNKPITTAPFTNQDAAEEFAEEMNSPKHEYWD